MVRSFHTPPVDPALLLENEELHRRGYFGGQTIKPFLPLIGRLCQRLNCRTLLDFGSGKGELWQMEERPAELRDVAVTLYDPAWPEHTRLPDTVFDAVVCVDVLEHVPERDLPATLDAISERALALVFLVICPRAGTKSLPFSGANVHVTIQPEQWWRALVDKHVRNVRTEIHFSI